MSKYLSGMVLNRKIFFTALLFSSIFFMVEALTLSDYGISWDETIHFRRGQAYLYFFLTGKTEYDLPKVNLQGENGDPENVSSPRRSFYQNDLHNGKYMLKNDSGHPPVNGELAALSNFVFYQKLGLLSDIESHHLFNILAASLLVFIVVYFAYETLGFWAGFISYLSLVTYPLFFSEAHFNIKDPPEAAFFAGSIWAIIHAIQTKKVTWLVMTIIFLTLALGTKFNVLFLGLIIGPFLIFKYGFGLLDFKKIKRKFSKNFLIVVFLLPAVVFALLFVSWPYLWKNPENILNILYYYKDIGTIVKYQPDQFYFLGFNLFPIQWIFFTTPPLVLILAFIGGIYSFIDRKKYHYITLLWLIWFLVPIIRVSFPGTSIYGGIRQIMEFLPALCLLAGFGATKIINYFKTFDTNKSIIATIFLSLLFLYPLFNLYKMHPNQNVYFNSLIGGLRGAGERNFPSWGNSFGNAYKNGIKWINKNAPLNSKLSLIQGTAANVPIEWIRKDIDYKNANWSGFDKRGEYIMDLTFNDTGKSFNFTWEYLDKFLTPVYEEKVDDVAILKIWKNDLIHTKIEMRKNKSIYLGDINLKEQGNVLIISLDKVHFLAGLEINLHSSLCSEIEICFVEISKDGQNWVRQKDQIPFAQLRNESNLVDNKINYQIAGKEAKEIKLVFGENIYVGFNKTDIIISILQ